LVDTARERGKDGYLIDDVRELKPEWLEGRKAVLVTAGASAPEHLVEQLLQRLRDEYAGQIDVRTLVEEDINFAPPPSLRSLTVVS
jgi:4-hydroxy-3-methylbut-2-enyl diphosphate reductase